MRIHAGNLPYSHMYLHAGYISAPPPKEGDPTRTRGWDPQPKPDKDDVPNKDEPTRGH